MRLPTGVLPNDNEFDIRIASGKLLKKIGGFIVPSTLSPLLWVNLDDSS